METVIAIIPLVAGTWMIVWSLYISSTGFASVLIFKTVPFFLGLACLFSGAKLLGWI